MYKRKQTKKIKIGSTFIGGDAPILIQSMTNTKTSNVEETVNQIKLLQEAGCMLVRVSVFDLEDSLSIKKIKEKIDVNLVCDIHFDYKLALNAIDGGCDKLRINPGNMSKEGLVLIVEKCLEKNIPIRVGVNSGSLDKEIEKEFNNTSLALVESAKKSIKLLEDLNFYNIVVSMKSSDIEKTIEAYEIFSNISFYPLHLGLTEAGTFLSGSIKSTIVLSSLLRKGIGDTIRVSLTTSPLEEIKVGKEILSSLGYFEKPNLISCPTCGRIQYQMIEIVKEIETFLSDKKSNIKVAIMGCSVNGPGEAKDADIGICGGKNCAFLFKKGQIDRKLEENEIIRVLKNEITILIDNLGYKFFDFLTDEVVYLREKVFVEEQGFKEEFDTIDKYAKFVVLYKSKKPIGTGRIYKDGDNYHIGRLCLLKEYRNSGYGSIIIMLLEKTVNDSKKTFILSSQDQAVKFYQKNGYDLLNESYYEEHCLHQKMIKNK